MSMSAEWLRKRRSLVVGWPLTVTVSTNTFVATGVTLPDGAPVKVHSDSPTDDHLDVPAPLAVETVYYVINATAV